MYVFKDNVFWYVCVCSDVDGYMYCLISEEEDVVCLFSSCGFECWEFD